MTAQTREEELARLIAEQEKDAEWGHRIGPTRVPINHTAISLDYTYEDGDGAEKFVGERDSSLDSLLGENETFVRNAPGTLRWNRALIIKAIKAWVKEHGEPPCESDWKPVNGRGVPGPTSVRRVFGTWSAAIAAAGFEPRSRGGTKALSANRLRRRIRRARRTSYLTPEKVRAAYVIYDRQKLSTTQLAELLYREYGYRNVFSCRTALLRAFHADDYPLRTRSDGIRQSWTKERREYQASLLRDTWAGRKAA